MRQPTVIEKGRPEFERSVELAPSGLRFLRLGSWSIATFPVRSLRDPDRALALAQEAVRLAPNESRGSCYVAAAHYARGDWENCLAAVEQCTRLGDAEPGYTLLIRAMAHAQQGERDQAALWYKRASSWIDRNAPFGFDYLLLRNEVVS